MLILTDYLQLSETGSQIPSFYPYDEICSYSVLVCVFFSQWRTVLGSEDAVDDLGYLRNHGDRSG